jgi:DNA repair photolyase
LIVKRNAAELLDKNLTTRRKKVTIGTGSMSDPYIPAEKQLCITENVLKTIIKHAYPFHIITKSDLIIRDIELLKEINKTFLSVCFTITTCDPELAHKIEPKAPNPSRRLAAIKQLSEAGIYTGVLFQPVLPFLLDTEENIEDTVHYVKKAGAKFIIPWFAVTTRKGQREHFFEKLKEISPEIYQKYRSTFPGEYVCTSPNSKKLYKFFEKCCKKYKIEYKMSDIINYNKLNPYKQMTFNELFTMDY